MENGIEKIKKVKRIIEMPSFCKEARENILKNFESKTDGLDIERVSEFLWSLDLPVSEFVFFNDEDLPELDNLCKDLFDLKNSFANGVQGSYLSELDIIFVRKGAVEEKNIDSVSLEGVLVHEQAHASNTYEDYSEIENAVWRPRCGFVLPCTKFPWGSFLEEGFADLLRGEYSSQNISDREKEKNILKEKEIENSPHIPYRISRKYFYNDEESRSAGNPDGIVWSGSSIAATGLEMLCEKEPKLRQTLIESRSDIEKLREIPRLINAIKPGLYLEIQKCAYSEDEFARVQQIIIDAVQNSK